MIYIILACYLTDSLNGVIYDVVDRYKDIIMMLIDWILPYEDFKYDE